LVSEQPWISGWSLGEQKKILARALARAFSLQFWSSARSFLELRSTRRLLTGAVHLVATLFRFTHKLAGKVLRNGSRPISHLVLEYSLFPIFMLRCDYYEWAKSRSKYHPSPLYESV
jgi:hypothetical protein